MNWTAPLLKEWLKREFGIKYKDRAVLNILARLGFSHTRPPIHWRKWINKSNRGSARHLKRIKKLENGEIDTILFEDESTIRDYMAIGYSWFLKGKQHKVPTFGLHQSVKLLGILDYEKGTVFCAQEESFDAQVFLSFLKKMLERYPTGKIVRILDNARIHHAKQIQPFLEKHAHQLELAFLPPYSPELNPIEGLWKWLKTSIVYNVFYSSVQEIEERVQTFIDELNQHPERIIDRLCVVL